MPYLPDGFASNLKSMSLTSFVFFSGAYTGVGYSWCLKICVVFTELLL